MKLFYLHSAADPGFGFDTNLLMATCTTPLMSNEANNFSNQEIYSSLLNKEDTEKVKYGRHPCHISLNAQQLMICQAKNTSKVLAKISTDSIVGATSVLKANCHKLEVFYYPLKTGCCVSHKDGNKRVRKTIVLNFMKDQAACQNWMNVIRYVSSGLSLPPQQGDVESGEHRASREGTIVPPPTRNFLVIVNPVGGQRQGRQIWKKWLEPMLREANVVVTLLITERADHAKDMLTEMQTDPASSYQAILCVGGDGIVFEVVNGLIHRAGGEELLKRLPIVHIPGGTGNGLSKSVLFACHEACTPLNAAFVAVKGHPQALDLARVTTADGKEHISFLSLAWGLISDVDILSESMRYLGETRLYIAAVYFMIRRRYYAGRLRMKLVESDEGQASTTSPVAAPDSNGSSNASNVDEEGWTTIESPFLLFWAVQTSHTAITIHSGPGVKLDDGIFTIAVCQEMSRFHMIELLLGMDSGAHYQHPKVKVFRCREYTLEPLTDKGIYSLDGEVVPYGKIGAVVLPSAATTLSL